MGAALDVGARRIAHGSPGRDGLRGVTMVSVVMGLRRRAGEAKGRGRNQGRRRETSKPANSKATVTQRHERPPDFDATASLAAHRCVTHTIVNDMTARLRSG